jgi:hypothetical protein
MPLIFFKTSPLRRIVTSHFYHNRDIEKSSKYCSHRGGRSPSRALSLLLDDTFSLYYKAQEELFKQKCRNHLTEMCNLDQVQRNTKAIEHYTHSASYYFNLHRCIKLRKFLRFDTESPICLKYYLDEFPKISLNNRPTLIRTQQVSARVINRCFAG